MCSKQKDPTGTNWHRCPGQEAFMAMKDEIHALREDQRETTRNLNKLTLTVHEHIISNNAVIDSLHKHNELQNGHRKNIAESLGKITKYGMWGGGVLLFMQVLMVSGLVTTVQQYFAAIFQAAGKLIGM